ncbi:MAG: hypothetical protein R3D32_03825 [Nitratireductor sp.]
MFSTVSFAGAQVSDTELRLAQVAGSEIVDSILKSQSQAQMPRISDPGIAAQFAVMLPDSASRGDVPDIEEMARLAELTEISGKIVRAYVLAGTGSNSNAGLNEDSRQMAGRNFIVFLPEIATLYDYRVRIASRMALGGAQLRNALSAERLAEPAVGEAMRAIDETVSGVVVSVLGCSSDDKIDQRWRLERLTLLLSRVEDFAALLDTAASQEIADQALAAAISEQSSPLAAPFKDFALSILR